jgi:DNA polymerase-1
MGPQRLSRETALSVDEAKDFIERYFAAFPRIRSFLDGLKQKARERGFAETILGRRRRLPDLMSSNRMLLVAAENMAVNTPIQGSAADILKVAMVRVHSRLQQDQLRSRMILTVHDELVFDVPEVELAAVSALVRSEMEGAYPLRVPLKVEAGSGRNWLEAH